MLIPRSVLAARKCGDTESSRYALGGLHLTRDYDNQPYAVATDGRCLVALAWPEPPQPGSATNIDLAHRPGCAFTVPTAALDKIAACKIGVKSPNELHHYVAVQEPIDDKAFTAPIMVTNGDETARFEPKLQEGRFPRWRDVAPAPTTDDITFCVNAKLLVKLLEAVAAHTGDTVTLSLSRENTFIRPLVVTAKDHDNGNRSMGVIMPFGDGKNRPVNQWQAEADHNREPEAVEAEPAPELTPELTPEPIAAPEPAPVAEVEPPAPELVTAPAPEPAPSPAPEPVDNRPIGRRPRAARAPRELVAAGPARDTWEAANY